MTGGEKKFNLQLTMMIILGWTLEDGVIRIEAARRTSGIGRVQALTHVGLLYFIQIIDLIL